MYTTPFFDKRNLAPALIAGVVTGVAVVTGLYVGRSEGPPKPPVVCQFKIGDAVRVKGFPRKYIISDFWFDRCEYPIIWSEGTPSGYMRQETLEHAD